MVQEAWSRAHGAARAAGVELRPLSRLEDGDRILHVMVATWGEHQLIPREMLRAFGDSASPPLGAFADEELIGYVLGWIARDPEDGLVVHSHMLAALPDRRHRGVGYSLKLAQRAQALEAGIDVVRWTFDPLIARNAWLNLSKLGAVADRFHRDYYGPMDDLVNRGERTDRLVVRWDLRRPPDDVPVEGAPVLLEAEDDAPTPTGAAMPDHGPALIRIPRDHERLRADRPELARAWRDPVAGAIEACIASGRIARALTRDAAYVFA
ncbi:MAG TPA: GNAT family N-acetyltransferase [Actinomycetota bacterium]|nr:GNAT family N-acetyltransferase [Actinomycetota bacterium]